MYRLIVVVLSIMSLILLIVTPFIHGRGQINLYVQMLLYVTTLLGLYMSALFGNIQRRKRYVSFFMILLISIILMHMFKFWIA
ncbi:hypothetical protein ROU88_00200 [Macrococcus capreoli]|uniref:hypothetical protein n=1 Tax=Macrococcus capreoli TaxID=2982690 RepID=UPI0021D5BA05|nr:hypothetical protein [Macrococcus sp. TMW 2.2395]MCU7556450.1 hypothetical protein [Macrococcus sp. TMW 2.2395]